METRRAVAVLVAFGYGYGYGHGYGYADGSVTVATHTGEARACLPIDGGDALIGTDGGLVRVDEKGAPRGTWTASDGLPGTRVDGVIADGARAWIATDGGVAEITAGDDGGVTIARAIATRPARDVARWGGAVYVATWDGGVVKLAARGTGATAIAMKGGAKAPRARVAALAVADGALWAGTDAGLYRLRGARFERVATEGVTAIGALAGDGARLWIGTSGGLYVREADVVRAIGGGEVRRLAMIDGALMIAGADGLATVDRGRVTAVAGAPALGIAEAIGGRGGARCAGGLGGLWLRSDADASWLHPIAAAGPPSNDISALAVDGDRLYVGTFDQGLAIREDGAWRTLDDPAIDRRINALLVEPRAGQGARIWIGTAEGVIVLDGDSVHRIGKRDGLPGRNVLTLVRTSAGRIVAGTSQGAAFVDGAGPERVGPRADAGQKEIGNVWAIAEAPAGTLWLGTTTGLYRGPATAWTAKDGADDAAAAATAWQRFSVATGALGDDWVTALVARGTTVWAGTYRDGVARIDATTGAATQLGGGWINPSGLTWDGDRLRAATMEGLVVGDGARATWTTVRGLPGKDTTAVVRAAGTLWIATRRGLAALGA